MSLMMNAGRSVLVLVDYQARLLPAIDQADRVVAEAVLLADAARTLGIRVVGTEQNPAGLGPNAAEVRDRCDRVVSKVHFDGCADGLTDVLIEGRAASERPEVVIAGCEAHVCLLQTALGLRRHGFPLWVVESACGSRRATDKQAAMRRLGEAGATLVTTEMVLFEWLGSCSHPEFKTLLQRIKRHG